MKFRVLVLAAALLIPSTVNAQEERYQFVAVDSDMAVYVDMRTVRPEGDRRTYWSLWVFHDARDLGHGNIVKYRKLESVDDCRARTSQTLYHIIYDADGNSLGHWGRSESGQPVVPGSTEERLLRFVCSGEVSPYLMNFPRLTEHDAIRYASEPPPGAVTRRTRPRRR